MPKGKKKKGGVISGLMSIMGGNSEDKIVDPEEKRSTVEVKKISDENAKRTEERKGPKRREF